VSRAAVAWINPLSLRCLLAAGTNGAIMTALRATPKPGDIALCIDPAALEIIRAEPWLKSAEVRERLEGQ
jgi:hypothetical protein